MGGVVSATTRLIATGPSTSRLSAPVLEVRLCPATKRPTSRLGANQYIGSLHTDMHSSSVNGWQLTFHFDEGYCTYFGRHGSAWRLWLADPALEGLRASQRLNVSVDGHPPTTVDSADFLRESVVMEIPAGLGKHVWRIEPAK
jgi:hypothetical protein